MVKIIQCTCKHDFQDKTYGKGNRVANTLDKTGGGARCTVCGKVVSGGK